MKEKVFILVVSAAFVVFFGAGCGGVEESPVIGPSEVAGDEYMKVSFYTIDRQRMSRGEYVGFAELKGNRLIVEVSETELEEILKNTYATMTGDEVDGKHITRFVDLEPGTPGHLKAIASEIHRHGYISRVEKK